MLRFSLFAIPLALSVHLFRFGYSTQIWTFLLFTGVAFLSIVFGDEIGSYTGRVRGGYIDTPTPGIVVRIIGFLLLLAFCILFAMRGDALEGRRRYSEGDKPDSLVRYQ